MKRRVLAVASTFFTAGIGLGLLLPPLVGMVVAGEEESDAASKYVERFAAEYSLTGEQRRILWMIITERDDEELNFIRSRFLSNSDQNQLRMIKERADQRIMQLLDENQRQQFKADLVQGK